MNANNKNSYEDYQRAVVEAYRKELMRRYSDAYIEGFLELKNFAKGKREKLRQFFLKHLYPSINERPFRDAAFESLGGVLRSPKKMLVLMKSALSSVWTLGRQFPAAAKAGFRTLETYSESHRLEKALIEAAFVSQIPADAIQHKESLAKLIRSIPEKDVLAFRKNILLLFESLANAKLLEGSLEAMRHSQKVMLSHPNLFSQEELSGIKMGIEMLEEGYNLFSSLQNDELELIIKGIDMIERRWYEEMKKVP